MKYMLKGTVRALFETKQVSERFSKREFVVETADNPKYPQVILLQATGASIEMLDRVHNGDEVMVDFEIRGREWKSPSGETKFFVTLDAWKIEVTKTAPPPIVAGDANAGIPF